jgi:hypothetical protein
MPYTRPIMAIYAPSRASVFWERNKDRVLRRGFKLWTRLTGNPRPSSYPYVSGDSFRTLADHIYDETGTCDAKSIQRGDIVFVSNPCMREYLTIVHPYVAEPYILIEHNGDASVDQSIADLLDENIYRFYAQNVEYKTEKIIPIPLALENLHYHVNGVPSQYRRLRKLAESKKITRLNRIFYKFSLNTNPEERGPALKLFDSLPYMDTASQHLSSKTHARKLMEYAFVASPRGNSIESSRTWEALLVRTVPIVRSYASLTYFASLGLPIWVIADWSELEGLSEEYLAAKYDELMISPNWEPLFMPFWVEKIRGDQRQARGEHT